MAFNIEEILNTAFNQIDELIKAAPSDIEALALSNAACIITSGKFSTAINLNRYIRRECGQVFICYEPSQPKLEVFGLTAGSGTIALEVS
jgi:hypothetical protein